ncbi:hypothetical protein K1719_024257 [Acacia pycnantha]|nr:hypothetical protein K1719_024257 [Acacia pycnantha]
MNHDSRSTQKTRQKFQLLGVSFMFIASKYEEISPRTGRTVVVGLDSIVRLVAEPVFGGDKKFLVESNGQLLLVDKYLSFDYQCLGAYDGFDDDVCFGWEQAVKFDVFMLNEESK